MRKMVYNQKGGRTTGNEHRQGREGPNNEGKVQSSRSRWLGGVLVIWEHCGLWGDVNKCLLVPARAWASDKSNNSSKAHLGEPLSRLVLPAGAWVTQKPLHHPSLGVAILQEVPS